VITQDLYAIDEVAELPSTAVLASLGVANPTALAALIKDALPYLTLTLAVIYLPPTPTLFGPIFPPAAQALPHTTTPTGKLAAFLPGTPAAQQAYATLAPGALVVMGHYDPSILYTIGRKGWEEDPHLWTPFNEQSAIRKGARYFISVEHARLKQTNLELYCWLARFPVRDPAAAWPVYETDPAKVLPGAEERWKAFRRREMAGTYANWRRTWKTAPDPCR